jgi:integrase/recombinase XerC/integrase/recombinase XerD
MTLQNAIDEFLIEQQVRGNSSKTVLYYRRCLGYFASFVGSETPLPCVDLQLCKRYSLHLAGRAISSVTRQTYTRALRAFLAWCFSEGYIIENIPAKFRLPKAQRKAIDVLTDDEIRRLFACFNLRTMTGARNFAICALMLDSGLRLNEVVTLESGSIHIAEGYVIVNGKGGKQRMVPLGLQSKRALVRYLGRVPPQTGQTLLFVKDTLTPLRQSTVKQLFRALKTRAKIPRLHPHLLRHTFATRYLQHGGDVYSLQQILGHTTLEMVRCYVHLTGARAVVNFPQFSPLDHLLKNK